jgi:hypothetical protein
MPVPEHFIDLTPSAGFGNRLRALISGICAAEDCNRILHVLWRQEVGVYRGELTIIFSEQSFPSFVRIESIAPGSEEDPNQTLCNSPDDWSAVLQTINSSILPVSIKSYGQFYQSDPLRWMHHLQSLQPNPIFKAFIDNLFSNRSVVGVHIRRTDNIISIQNSPTSAFVAAMRAYPRTTFFFVASDDDSERKTMQAIFPGRILIAASIIDRLTVNGGVNSFLDFLGLSMCSEILGSASSSFSEMAAAYGGISLKVINK